MRPLTDVEIDAFLKLPEPEDKMSPLWGMIDVMKTLAQEVQERRALIGKNDVELLQVVRGVLSVDIEDSESHRDAMKEVFPQFSDMCQGSVDDYKNADALLVRLIASAGGAL